MRKLLKIVIVVLVCYIIAVVSNAIFLDQIVISGNSMESNFSNGEFGLADKQLYKITKLKRFDVVVIEQDKEYIVKRVVGLPNETIEYKNGVLKVNNEVINESFISDNTKSETNRDGLEISITLKENEYYVLGDNRYTSYDSRNFGPVDFDNIKGRLFVIYGQCSNLVCEDNTCKCDKKYFIPRFI